MGRREEMVKLAEKMMQNRENIRNIGIVAHIDHGKCIDGKARIALADGRVMTAEEVFQLSALQGKKVRETKNETIFALDEPLELFSVNKGTGRVEKKIASHAWKLTGGKMLKVKLRNGYSIATTPEHQYLTFDGLSFGFKQAKELRKGDRVVAARKLKVKSRFDIEKKALKLLSQKQFYVKLREEPARVLKQRILAKGTEEVRKAIGSKLKKASFKHSLWRGILPLRDLLQLIELFEISYEKAYSWIEWVGLKNSTNLRLPKNWKQVFYIAGLMVGDGTGNRFVVGKKELGKRFAEACDELGLKPKTRKYEGKTPELTTNNSFLIFLNALFDYPLKKKSRNVKISDFVREAPDNLVAEFLKAYFDCDGAVEKERSAVSITSASKEMLLDLQMLLPRFGCIAINQGETLYLSGESAKSFAERVGFGLREKQLKAMKLKQKSTGSVVCDVVPCYGLKNAREALKISKASIGHHYYKYENGTYCPQINTYKSIQLMLAKKGIATKIKPDELAFIEITGIQEEEAETVYDFTVPENHNFVAEGIVIHNTTMTDNLIAAAGLMSEELAGKQLFMDFYELEQQRGITINSANISLVHKFQGKEYLVNVIDTPGHIDFGGEVIRAMRAVDGVVVVVDSVEGVMPQTETVIRQALREKVKPTLFINKVDRLVNELQLNEKQMQERFVKTITQVNKLIRNNAPKGYAENWQVRVNDGSVSFGSAYYNWALNIHTMRETGISFKDVYDFCKNQDQKTLAKKSPLHSAILGMVIEHLPNPIEAQKYRISTIWAGEPESEAGKAMIACDENGPFSMMVTDVTVDPHAGDIATGRIYSGKIKSGMKVKLLTGQKEVGIQQVVVFMGPERVQVQEVPCGNIAGLVGVKEIWAGETISNTDMRAFESFKSTAEPVMTVSVEPKQTKDLPKLIEVIRQITKEDPNIVATLNQETGEHLISGMGELHLEVTQYRIEKDHKIAIEVSPPIVVYRETVQKGCNTLEGKSPNKHNKFKMRVEPLEKDVLQKLIEAKITKKIKPKDKEMIAKFEEIGFDRDTARRIWSVHNNNVFVDMTRGIVALYEIKEMVIQAFQDAMNEGPLAKEKCFGIKVILEDATLHEDAIHRGPAQVLPAITRTIYACVLSSDPMLLEPKQTLFITVPQDYMGNVSKELGQRRTQINEIKQEGDSSIFIAKAPVKELIGFSAAIRGATQGRAIWTAEYAGYEPLPR